MKSSLLTITLGIVLSCILVGMSPVSHAHASLSLEKKVVAFANLKEVIIQVAESNEKNLQDIRTNIEQGGGMHFKGYCKQFKVLLYEMDTDVHPDMSFLNVAFVNIGMGYLLKEGTIYQVRNECNMPATETPTQAHD
jgi:hypothetical protein